MISIILCTWACRGHGSDNALLESIGMTLRGDLQEREDKVALTIGTGQRTEVEEAGALR